MARHAAKNTQPVIAAHSGDLGDIVSCLPSIKALGGGEIAIGEKPNGQRESMRGARFDAIKPLLEAQPYVHGVSWSEDFVGVSHDFTGFRANYVRHENLALQHARHFGLTISLEPWLEVKTPRHGKVVIARSLRYHNPKFPWMDLMKRYRPNSIFVGLAEEHMVFQAEYVPRHIEHVKTENLLKLAEIIAGASLLICNQTCAAWIGLGLGVPMMVENWLPDMNTVIERPNCKYTRNEEEIKALLWA